MSNNMVYCLVALAIFVVGRWSLWLMERPKKRKSIAYREYDDGTRDYAPDSDLHDRPIQVALFGIDAAQDPARFIRAQPPAAPSVAHPIVRSGGVVGHHDAGNPMTG